jgi:alcohol dehydrogenase class IV
MYVNKIFNTNIAHRIDEYCSPSEIIFGNGAIRKAGECARRISTNSKVAVVTDNGLVALGLTAEIEKYLSQSGFSVDMLYSDAIEPTLGQIEKLSGEIATGDYGLIVGFGGGSSMDRAKIASCFAGIGDQVIHYVAPADKPLPSQRKIPKLLIPTTSGTGSEVSNTAVVIVPEETLGSTKTWITGKEVLADTVLIDPDLIKNLPPRVTAASGLDALSHCTEGILSKQANGYSDALALESVRLVSQSLRDAYKNGGENPESRWNMAMAAMIGGQVISFGWVAGPATLGHVVSEGLSPKLSMTHGDSCAVLLPYVYWFNLPDAYAQSKLAMIAEAMGIETDNMTRKQAAESAIIETFRLLEDVDIPTSLQECGMDENDIPEFSRYILDRAEQMYSMSVYNPVTATYENLVEFFNTAYHGKQALMRKLSV